MNLLSLSDRSFELRSGFQVLDRGAGQRRVQGAREAEGQAQPATRPALFAASLSKPSLR